MFVFPFLAWQSKSISESPSNTTNGRIDLYLGKSSKNYRSLSLWEKMYYIELIILTISSSLTNNYRKPSEKPEIYMAKIL